MPTRSLFCGLLITFAFWTSHAGASEAVAAPGPTPMAFGWVENVLIGKLGLRMKGKLDTGGDSSSVHAYDVELYKKGERDTWVKFKLVGKDGRTIRYDQNVVRFAYIKKKEGGLLRRPVIRMPICLGDIYAHAEVNLADRGHFNYDILVGREFLASRVLVDPSRTFVSQPNCEALSGE